MQNRLTLHLLAWYDENKRTLPWRDTTDPYAIWLSEVILQQTRIEQGISYYYRFLEQYPDVASLAGASDDDIMKLWQGLGYYSRARNLAHTAREIWKKYHGRFPNSYEELIQLRGIGAYTAAAIASIAFHEAVPVVDGNVIRFIARLYGIKTPVDKAAARKQIHTLVSKLMERKDPGRFNQALMEFGSLQCIKHNPACDQCPLASVCVAFNDKLVPVLPVKSVRQASRKRYFNYLLITDNKYIYIRKRVENDIWKSLYEFPLIETGKRFSAERLMASENWKQIFAGCKLRLNNISREYKHILTHQILYTRFYSVEISPSPRLEEKEYLRIPMGDLHSYPVSRLTEKYLQEFLPGGG